MVFTNNIIYFYDGSNYFPIIGELNENVVLTVPQHLTEEQQAQVLRNLGLVNTSQVEY